MASANECCLVLNMGDQFHKQTEYLGPAVKPRKEIAVACVFKQIVLLKNENNNSKFSAILRITYPFCTCSM